MNRRRRMAENLLDLQPSSDQQVRDRRRSRGAAAGLTIALANADRSAAISLSLENLFVFRPGSARAFGGVCCVSSKSKCRCHKNQLLWPLWPSSNVFAAHCYPPYQCKPIAATRRPPVSPWTTRSGRRPTRTGTLSAAHRGLPRLLPPCCTQG